jgi:PKD repeat protein
MRKAITILLIAAMLGSFCQLSMVSKVSAANPIVDFTWSPEMPLVNETVTFDASASYDPDGGKILSYKWNFGDGTIETVPTPTINHVYTAYGSYNVNLTVTDDQGEKAWLVKSITVRWYPEAHFTYSPERPLVGETVTFDASDSKPNGGTIIWYYWNFGDGVAIKTNVTVVTHIYTSVGNYVASLIVEDSENLNSTAYSVTISVIKPPRAEFSFSPDYPIAGQTVTFDASASTPNGGTIVWYYWNFGDGTYANITTTKVNHVYDSYGNYTVTLTIMDSEGLTDSTSETVRVRQYPKASFSYSPTLPLINEVVVFNASTSTPEGGSITQYLWSFGDGTTGEGMIISHAYQTFGTFTVTLTVTDTEGLSDTCTKSIRIAIPPVANFTFKPAYPIINQPVTFNASTSYDPDRRIIEYTWDFGDGNITTTSQPIITHAYAVADVYKVTLTVTDDDHLKNSTSKFISVYTSVPTHDVAIVRVTPSSIRVVSGTTISVNVTVENQGTAYETFTVSVYYDDKKFGEQLISNMPPSTSRIITFPWNTSGVALGYYTIKASASILTDEVDTADNIGFSDQKVEIGPLVWIEVQPAISEVGLLNKAFIVNVAIRNLNVIWRTVGVQFRLCYNDTLLEVVNVTEGPFMQDKRWNLYGSFFVYYVEKDPTFGPNIIVGAIIYPNETGCWNAYPYGDGVLATITFKAKYQERGLDKPPLTCDLKLTDLMIIDEDMLEIPLNSKDGVFKMYPTNIGDLDYNGKVDARDIALICKAFGSSATVDTKRWNPNYDINKDGKIDVRDIAVVCKNFGWKTKYDP